ncbi:MAG TPA: 4-(cytidine 5'-diphospho)-2-C-methyl-D-erythritol kinase [Rhizomicrobium sp.]|nr:4-(cytidine 5'-diphospho)-2-C-methyl-D-erythritol kinase [Rhizomicrobium sp.]
MAADAIRVFAPAKINLFLHVGERRADGFHELESLVAFADAGDALGVAPAETLTLALDGPFAKGLEAETDNLVLRAARAFPGAPPAALRLTKNLPVASGIGGGSADAAAALRGLAALYPGRAGEKALLEIAASLGSDIPACVLSRPLMMRGRGERLEVLPRCPALDAVLVNPGVAVPTGPVFAALRTRTGLGHAPKAADLAGAEALIAFLRTARNDLEAPARALAPAVGDVLGELARMPGLRLARMSGSGATCFGLFADGDAARMAAIALSHSHPGWWVIATSLNASP